MKLREEDLPVELSPFEAVEAAYPKELTSAQESLRRSLPVMIECDKELTPFFYKCLRDRLKKDELRCIYLDGRVEVQGGMPQSIVSTMIGQLREAVRGAVDRRVVVLPHLDLMTTSSGALTSEAREVISLLYENPQLLWVGFKDPSFVVPKVIERLFARRESIIGIPRDRLRYLVTQRESRKFGKRLNPYQLYKYVSGVNAVRLRRLLESVQAEDYAEDPSRAYDQLRQATVAGDVSIPDIDLDDDIGGYDKVKRRLKQEIISLLARKDGLEDAASVQRIESLLPRGMIFWGPPGTGKTLFAKAMATSLGAAVVVVSGPELKSRWVGESEERIRQVFVRARQSAPSIIIFDELDSFATARGTYTGSGVEHSMVNQLLTEMDGFRLNELVFVVGTTNFAESLDPALLRPGRFEFHLQVPYPAADDRRAIFEIYDRKLSLQLSARALDYAVKRTADLVEGTDTRYSGDHIQALCRAVARRRVRDEVNAPTEVDDIERALTEYLERPELTAAEERVVATHEAGHAVCALYCPTAPPIDRISIRGDLAGALGFVSYSDPAHRYVTTQAALRDSICTLYGGREAESLLLDDVSIGAMGDLQRATGIARGLVEQFGFGPDSLGLRIFEQDKERPGFSEDARRKLEEAVRAVLDVEQARARQILAEHQKELEVLRDLLLEHKVLDATALAEIGIKKKRGDDKTGAPKKRAAKAAATTTKAAKDPSDG
ncbi:MAG: AAA family ATPase [Myxococcales bacterium]|nr:AAA family ATPase [Myxococcales bacterium]